MKKDLDNVKLAQPEQSCKIMSFFPFTDANIFDKNKISLPQKHCKELKLPHCTLLIPVAFVAYIHYLPFFGNEEYTSLY